MENINLIRKIAWSFHQSTGMEFEDLFQEAYIAYDYALRTHDPKKGKITTYLWWCISAQLKRYLYKQEEYKCKKYQQGVICSLEDIFINQSDSSIPFWESLSKEAQEVANLVLMSPKPFIEASKPKAQKRVKDIMSKRGWSMRKIEFCLMELKIIYS